METITTKNGNKLVVILIDEPNKSLERIEFELQDETWTQIDRKAKY